MSIRLLSAPLTLQTAFEWTWSDVFFGRLFQDDEASLFSEKAFTKCFTDHFLLSSNFLANMTENGDSVDTLSVNSTEPGEPAQVAGAGDYMDRALRLQGEIMRLISGHDDKKSLHLKLKSEVQCFIKLVID